MNASKDVRWYLKAQGLAAENPYGYTLPVSMGAVIFRGKRTISTGVNRPYNAKTKRVNDSESLPCQFYSTHAELDALISAPQLVRGCSIAVAGIRLRTLYTGMVSRPCNACRAMLIQSGIKYVVYLNENGEVVKEELQ